MEQELKPICRFRFGIRWCAAWIAMVVGGIVLHALAWVPPDRLNDGLSRTAEQTFIKPAASVVDVFTGPAWLVMNLTTGDWGVYSLPQSILVHAITVTAMFWAFRIAARIRQRVVRGWTKAIGDSPEVNQTRRRFLFDAPFAAATVVGSGAVANGAIFGAFDLQVRRYTIPVADLSEDLVGFKAVLIADTHLGPRIPADFIRKAVSMSINLRPDVFLLGGDYIHAGTRYIKPAVELFRPLVASGRPTIGVLGNHDWYNSRGLVARYLAEIGVRMVDNAHVLLDARTRTIASGPIASVESLCIAGVGDILTDEVNIHRALLGVPANTPRVVLCHNPDGADLASMQQQRIDLMLCGHTHGGQVAFPLVGAVYVPCRTGTKYLGGLINGPGFPVLVSRGVGMSICPVRIGVPPEIVEITLVKRERA